MNREETRKVITDLHRILHNIYIGVEDLEDQLDKVRESFPEEDLQPPNIRPHAPTSSRTRTFDEGLVEYHDFMGGAVGEPGEFPADYSEIRPKGPRIDPNSFRDESRGPGSNL